MLAHGELRNILITIFICGDRIAERGVEVKVASVGNNKARAGDR